jgi:hypothetical protein
MIFTIPNSLGSTPLREENLCHLPGGSAAGGQFGSKLDCNVAVNSPLRLKPVEDTPGQPSDDRIITSDEATAHQDKLLGDLDDTESGSTRAEVKASIAEALGARLEGDPGLEAFYNEYHSQFKSYGGEDDEGAGIGAPDPEDVKDEYDSELEEAYDKAREEAESQAIDEVKRQYTNKQDDVSEERMYLYEEALAAWAAREPNSVGDISMVGSLPFEGGPVGPTAGRQFSPAEIVDQWEKDGENAEFLSYYMLPERRDDADKMAAYREAQNSGQWSKSSTMRPVDLYADLLKGTEYEQNFDDLDWDEKVRVSRDLDYNLEDIEVDDSDIGIGSFESWYQDKYGIDPDKWSPARSSASPATAVAAFLISSWASTSGDASKLPVAIQLAVAKEFGLHTSYTGEFFRRVEAEGMETDPFVREVTAITDKHGALLQHFARAMYENTQEDLKARGITEVVVYRGVKGRSGSGLAHLESLDTPGGHGIFADLNLQPASSFSTSFFTAKGFGKMVILTRVPANRVLGTCRSGWGCLNEQEVVLLGGRLPGAYVANTDDISGPHIYWEDYQRIFQGWLRGRS